MKRVAVVTALVPTLAAADVVVRVAPDAPFTSTELVDAVDLRTEKSGVIEVSEADGDEVVVVIGTRARRIVLPRADSAAQTRLVAVIITSMLESEPSADVEVPADLTRRPAAERAPWSFDVKTGVLYENSGYDAVVVGAGLGIPVRPQLRATLSASLLQEDDYKDTQSVAMLLRVGLEGRSGPLALEVGAQLAPYVELSNGASDLGAMLGPYAAVSVSAPMRDGLEFGVELGGFVNAAHDKTLAISAYNHASHGGWLSLKMQWAR